MSNVNQNAARVLVAAGSAPMGTESPYTLSIRGLNYAFYDAVNSENDGEALLCEFRALKKVHDATHGRAVRVLGTDANGDSTLTWV